MNSKWVQLLSIAVIAIGLLLADRYLRIQPMLYGNSTLLENFQMPVLYGLQARACGVDLESCPDGTKCGNGLCINTDARPLEEKYPLPVLPARV